MSIRIYVLKTLIKIIQENRYIILFYFHAFFPSVQEKIVRILIFVLSLFFSNHGQKDIINNIVKPYFGNFVFDKDDSIRSTALDFLIKLCSTYKGNYMESILDILEKVNLIK